MVTITFKQRSKKKDEYKKRALIKEIYEGLLGMRTFTDSHIKLIDSEYMVDGNGNYMSDDQGNYLHTDKPIDEFTLTIGEKYESDKKKEIEVFY